MSWGFKLVAKTKEGAKAAVVKEGEQHMGIPKPQVDTLCAAIDAKGELGAGQVVFVSSVGHLDSDGGSAQHDVKIINLAE